MQECEPLAQIIDSAVDELQDTDVDTDIAVSTHDGNIDGNTTSHEIWHVMIQTVQLSKGYMILRQLWTLKHLCSLTVFRLHKIA